MDRVWFGRWLFILGCEIWIWWRDQRVSCVDGRLGPVFVGVRDVPKCGTEDGDQSQVVESCLEDHLILERLYGGGFWRP